MWGARAHVLGGAPREAGRGVCRVCAAGRSTPPASELTRAPAGGSAPLAEAESGAALPPTVTCFSVPACAQPAALYSSGAPGEGTQ